MTGAQVVAFPERHPEARRAARQGRPRRPAALPTRRPGLELALEAWFECYLADCEARGLTTRTLEWYRDRGGRIVALLERAEVSHPDELTRRAVSELFAQLRRHRHKGKGLAPQTIHGYWQVGKGFATFLIAEGVHPGPNPFDEFGRPRVPEKSMWAPSAEECRAILGVPDRRSTVGLRNRVIVLLLLDTGVRVSALRSIRIADVDLQGRRMRVIEKGQRERVVPFGFQALRWLRRYLATTRLEEENYLLPGQDGRPLSRKRIDQVIKECARFADVRDGRVSAHDLRRAFAREFLRNGGDLESLRQLLGHSSYAMVRRYAELASEVVAEAHRRASPGDRLRL